MSPRIALLAALSTGGPAGGAERLFSGLCDGLNAAGLKTELVPVYSNEGDFDQIRQTYLRYYDLDLSEFDGVISAKAPSYVVRHRNHVCYLMHTMRVFYDMFEFSFPTPTHALHENRRLIHALDTAALEFPRTRHIFSVGEEVALRLRRFNGLEAEVMRHPSTLQGLRQGAFRYLFLPGRLHKWKRVDLAIQAMRLVQAPVDLIISGTGEDEDRLRQLAAGNGRVRFVGQVSEQELAALYADALAVLFTPQREDLGLVTLEAFQSGKPVITCTDSGEPTRLVRDGVSGFVCPPDAASLARCIDQVAAAPGRAAEMGLEGMASIRSIAWPSIAARLAAALGFADQVKAAP